MGEAGASKGGIDAKLFSIAVPDSGRVGALDDVQDKQATIRWLSRWTGVQVPSGKFVKYYLVVGPDRPKLLPADGVEVPPTDGQGSEVYMLRVDSSDSNTDLPLVR